MSRFKEFVKKWGPVCFFAAGSLAIAGITYYVTRPEGVQLRAEADGVLTKEEEKQMLDFLDSYDGIESYSPVLKSFVNDFDVFAAREFEARGLPSNRFDKDIHILIADNNKIDSVCGEWAGGCWSKTNSTIYLRNDSDPFWTATTINHEIGHSLRTTVDSPELDELSSQSNELYTKIKMYCFNKEIGTEYINSTLEVSHSRDFKERSLPYILGNIGFLVQANKTKGDLERALYNILNDRQDDSIIQGLVSFFTGSEGCLECDTQNAVRQYPSLSNAYYSEYRKLIEQPHFVEGLLRHRGMAETHEMIEYLRLRLDFSKAYSAAIAEDNNISLNEIFRGFRERANAFIQYTNKPSLEKSVHENIIEELNLTFCSIRDTVNCDYPK